MTTPTGRSHHRMFDLAVADDGVAVTEYAVVIGLFAVAAIAALWLFGGTLTETFSQIADQVPDASPEGFSGASATATDPTMLTHGSPPRMP